MLTDFAKIKYEEFTPSLLQKTSSLLQKNPEYYTIWNHRRRIYQQEFSSLSEQVKSGTLEEPSRQSQILDVINLDLQFLFPLLLKFPKCYWIWHHRLWILQSSTSLLPTTTSRTLWSDELTLVGKMLSRDSRNYHGWSYRRTVIAALESPELNGSSMARNEFEYTTKMIGINLSNFSAWHNRTQLIIRMLNEEDASDADRKKMLDEELALIHKALFDPYDQSLWFYHQALMACFDPNTVEKTMAPNLSTEERLRYIAAEREFIEEVLEDARDCKWVYQSLIECAILEGKNGEGLNEEGKRNVSEWLGELRKLDPLRKGRWEDMGRELR
jgi:geranylgeranyl transferase type-2 subunit alpha